MMRDALQCAPDRSEMANKLLLPAIVVLFGIVRATQSATNYTSGAYNISYDDKQLPTLRIYSESDGLVWFSSPKGDPLLVATQVNKNVTQIGGNFIFKNEVQQSCTDTKITKAGTLPPSSGYPIVYFEGTLCDNAASFQLTFQDTVAATSPSEGGEKFHHLRFNATLVDPTGKYNQLRLVYGCESDELLYGFGAQYSKFNVKGNRLPVFLSEQGVGRGLQPFTFLLNLVSPGAGTL